MHRTVAAVAGLALVATIAGPATAAKPDHWVEVDIPSIYQQAECDGYEVWEYDLVTLQLFDFKDADGNTRWFVQQADSVGYAQREYPNGDTVQVATYKDKGGTFTVRGDDITWTGIIDTYTTGDGSVYRNVGRQVLNISSWDPFEAEWTMDVGINDEWDPCTW